MRREPAPPIELWGGVECTVNRVGDAYRDQTRLTGHHDRPEDLERIAELGVRRLRYPVLWERVAPDRPDVRDWRWSDDRLARIRRLGMGPIVGLVHHGSGPGYTDLLADDFAPLLGDFAAAAAERHPDVRDWTPINEPLTTARFSALYGHWHPHARDEALFWRALLNQIDATRAAMRAIRRVNPAARLIQTEDLGRCHSTEPLAGVAEYYNHRRWMTWDLLAGAVTSNHALWPQLERFGLGDRLRAIADDPCPADVIGVNHYVTSDRFLDDRAHAHAGPMPPEGYHDVAAARVLASPPAGLAGAVREAWGRYGTPVAVTECHLACTREEQVRWLHQGWRACSALAADGVGVVALTAWALLGSVDWGSLLTRSEGRYEAGAFDAGGDAGGRPRRTAVGALIRAIGTGAPVPAGVAAALAGEGWWRRDLRLEHPPYLAAPGPTARPVAVARPLLILCPSRALRRTLAHLCGMRGLPHAIGQVADTLSDLDLLRPWAVLAIADNDAAGPPERLAQACAARGIHLTLLVMTDAAAQAPPPFARAQQLVVRTASVFSAEDAEGLPARVERALRHGRTFAAASRMLAPVYAPDFAQACLDLVVDGATGVVDVVQSEALSEAEFARQIARVLGFDTSLVTEAGPVGQGGGPRRRSAGATTRSAAMPTLDDAIARCAAALRERAAPAQALAADAPPSAYGEPWRAGQVGR